MLTVRTCLGLSEGEVRLQLAAEEAERVGENVDWLEVSPMKFVVAGLDLEETQCVIL